MNVRLPLLRAILPVCIVAAALSSCRLLQGRKPPDVLEPRVEEPSEALVAAARFVRPDDDVPGFFKTTLADSGFAAVQVVLRNAGGTELWIHSGNGMDLGSGFAGMRLVCGSDTLEPVHPADVTIALVGGKQAQRFLKPSTIGVLSSLIVPPLGIYLIYEEVVTGKYYRPLFDRSLYPTLRSRLFEPIRLAPGAERAGWLYFDVAASGRDSVCELLVSACVWPADGAAKLPGYDFLFSRPALVAGDSLAGSPGAAAEEGDGYLFSLVAEKKTSALCRFRVGDMARDSIPAPGTIATLMTKSAELADAHHAGDRAAVAVNFNSKSRIFALAGEAPPSTAIERSFSRPIGRVFTLGERICAITENGYAHLFDAGSRPAGNGTSLAHGFDDAAFIGDTLFAFSNEKGLDVYAAERGKSELSSTRHYDAPRGTRRIAGASEGALVLIGRGKRIAVDTLVYFHPSARTEMRRHPMPGRVLLASCEKGSVALQLEDGTLLRLSSGLRSSFRIDEAGYLPFRAVALKALADAFIAVGPDGNLAAGAIREYRPGRYGAYDTSVVVQ